jgi:multisubunit Na+/H+ antiporter MnhG subunit
VGRDANLTKRNALVLPGGLLAFYGAVGLLLLVARGTSGACHDGTRIMYHGACYSLVWPLIAMLLLGAALVVLGAILFRGEPEGLAGQLHPGTPTHFTLALLVSLVALPLIGAGVAAVASGRLGADLTVGSGDVQVKSAFLLEAVAVIGVLMLAPFLGLLLRDGARRRRVLREAEAMADQGPYPGEEGAAAAAPPEEYVDDAAWPEARQ